MENDMNPTNYITATSRTDGDDKFYDEAGKRYADNARLLHYSLGIAGEAGELVDAVKKHVQYGKDLDIANIKEEIGDVIIYVVMLADKLGVDPIRAAKEKIEKNRKNYPEKLARGKANKYKEL